MAEERDPTKSLLVIRDELAVTRDIVVVSYLAASSPMDRSAGRTALCTVLDEARERLDAALLALDGHLTRARDD